MRLRIWLFVLMWLDIGFGWNPLFAPQKVVLVTQGVLLVQGVGSRLFGLGFALAAFCCLCGSLLWSARMEKRVPLWLIQRARIAAQSSSHAMIIVWSFVYLLGVLLNGVPAVGLIVFLVIIWIEASVVRIAALTPSSEEEVWRSLGSGKPGAARLWMARQLRKSAMLLDGGAL